jgi:hypothetical protein
MYGETIGTMARNAVMPTAMPERELEVLVQLQALGKAISNLDAEVAGMSERLSQVQRAAAPMATDAKTPVSVLCPLAQQIRSYAQEIDRLGLLLCDNRNRLEI